MIDKEAQPFEQFGSACELHGLPSSASSQSDHGDNHFSSCEALCNLLEAFNLTTMKKVMNSS